MNFWFHLRGADSISIPIFLKDFSPAFGGVFIWLYHLFCDSMMMAKKVSDLSFINGLHMLKEAGSFRRGFTLIELMIVIVILGVLMGTILPRLSSSQSRSRDLGRVADLNTISQALETYFDDYGQYPGVNGATECLVDGETANDAISEYLKGGRVPQPPSSGQTIVIGSTSCEGSYVYAPLKSRGLSNSGYMLAVDMETYQSSNYFLSNLASLTWNTNTGIEDITPFLQSDLVILKSKDTVDATNTIYVIAN